MFKLREKKKILYGMHGIRLTLIVWQCNGGRLNPLPSSYNTIPESKQKSKIYVYLVEWVCLKLIPFGLASIKKIN